MDDKVAVDIREAVEEASKVIVDGFTTFIDEEFFKPNSVRAQVLIRKRRQSRVRGDGDDKVSKARHKRSTRVNEFQPI